jgi:triosephosphate isomerase (TIM)
MNHGLQATREFFSTFTPQPPSAMALVSLRDGALRAWAFPPMTSLQTAVAETRHLSFQLKIGAQNVHWEKSGAFTGEVSGPMLAELGISRALTGHSERRQYFGETNETVHKRTLSLLKQDFQVVMCVGETRGEREAGKTFQVLTEQLTVGIGPENSPITEYMDGRLTIAYEPVWAIGTGLTATPEQAEEAHHVIREFLKEKHGTVVADRTAILYGGSVTPDNVDSLLGCPNVDGALVGGASLKPAGFLSLLEAGAKLLAPVNSNDLR